MAEGRAPTQAFCLPLDAAMRRDSLATIRRPGRATRLAAARIFVFVLASAFVFAFVAQVSILLLILICHGSTHRRVLT
ncbi:hypothetical protein KCU98_g17603, partial [Aureobasidium melanogenum]